MKKFENFQKALQNLLLIQNYEPPYDVVTQTGLVNLFVICFEQSWKAMKEILEEHGYGEGKTGSPKMIIKCAYQAGMIQDEKGWRDLLDMRNLAAHTYSEAVATDIIERTKGYYIALFAALEMEINNHWML